MDTADRRPLLIAIGVAVLALLLAAVHALAPKESGPEPASQQHSSVLPPLDRAAPLVASTARADCPAAPQLAARGAGDGRFQLEAAMALRDRPSADAFTKVAEEAIAQGRPRDAEVALIAACRVAGPGSQQAGTILARLEQLQAAAPRETTTMGAAAPTAADTVISLRCGAGSSPAERLVCGDEELAQLDSDLQRLRAQARSVSRDPGGMQRRSEQAIAQRDANCHDRGCLLRWYAQQRSRLLNEF